MTEEQATQLEFLLRLLGFETVPENINGWRKSLHPSGSLFSQVRVRFRTMPYGNVYVDLNRYGRIREGFSTTSYDEAAEFISHHNNGGDESYGQPRYADSAVRHKAQANS